MHFIRFYFACRIIQQKTGRKGLLTGDDRQTGTVCWFCRRPNEIKAQDACPVSDALIIYR